MTNQIKLSMQNVNETRLMRKDKCVSRHACLLAKLNYTIDGSCDCNS